MTTALLQRADHAVQVLDSMAQIVGDEGPRVRTVRGNELKIRPVRWLWPGWLAAGKLHILAGSPGVGKTTLALALAAILTTGGRWPDGTPSKLGNVAIWSGEDDPADTLAPRLAASGADLGRTHFVESILDGNERRPFDPSRDVPALRRRLLEIGDVRLLIVDPIVSAISGDSHKNAETRRGLQPLADLAQDIKCALIGITHLSKGTAGRDPVERVCGSLAFGAVARLVLLASKTKGEDGAPSRLLCRAKSNLGKDDGGFRYDLQQGAVPNHPEVFASHVLWGERVEGTARELLADAEAADGDEDGAGGGSALEDAKRFLVDPLSSGPLPAKVLRADVEGAGHTWATIKRAQKAVGIEAVKESVRGGWFWRLPAQDAQASPKSLTHESVSTLGKREHLGNHPARPRCSRNRQDAHEKPKALIKVDVHSLGEVEHLGGASDEAEAEI